jgi:isopenicillin-N N-acyltransferase-like protein
LIERHLRLIERLAGTPRAVLARRALRFAPLIEALSPALMDELHGLAEGAGISLAEAVLCQVRSEAARLDEEGCTAFALCGSATADGQTLAGQNQDLMPEYADVAILLRVRPEDGRPQALMATFAGQIGYAGMNEHGLAHFNTSLFDGCWRLGLPRQVLKRVLLEQRTVEECLDLLARQQVGSAANLVLCDGRGAIADVEQCPAGTALLADEWADCRLHTNHFLTPQFLSRETGAVPDSWPRLARMRQMVSQHWGQLSCQTLQAMLADHVGDPAGICRHGAHGWHTISGYVAEPAKGLFHVRRGYGCLGKWQTYVV